MKFLKKPRGLLCKLDEAEAEAFLVILSHYPVRKLEKYKVTKQKGFKEENELLKSSLKEYQKENRSLFDQIKKQLDPTKESQSFKLSFEQCEILLQILNDLRVGYWESIGSPSPNEMRNLNLEKPGVAKALGIMDITGILQAGILQTLDK